MRWTSSKREKLDLRSWHRWFAWFPVRIGDTKVWFEPVERKGSMTLMADSEGYPFEQWDFEYRTLDTV